MSSVDYKYWAEYLSEIHQGIGKSSDSALEIAAGNCKLSKYLKSEFGSLVLTDISSSMLKQNRTEFPMVCCNMAELPFKKEFDFIYSAFDSINYLYKDEKLNDFFSTIGRNLTENGCFVFDVSLKNNSIQNVKKLNRKGKYRGLEYTQISEFDEETQLHKNTVLMKNKDDQIFKEIHLQKIYDFYYYFEILENKDIYVYDCFEAFTFEEGTPESERIQFIVKRKN